MSKQELLLAAYELVGRAGVNKLMIEQVAKQTGASEGIVDHEILVGRPLSVFLPRECLP